MSLAGEAGAPTLLEGGYKVDVLAMLCRALGFMTRLRLI